MQMCSTYITGEAAAHNKVDILELGNLNKTEPHSGLPEFTDPKQGLQPLPSTLTATAAPGQRGCQQSPSDQLQAKRPLGVAMNSI